MTRSARSSAKALKTTDAMRLNALIRRVERVEKDVAEYVKAACEAEAEAIVEMNKAQLKAGINTDGGMMAGGNYAPTTIFRRGKRGLPVDHVYLDYEGGLQGGMYVEYGEEGFNIKTTDWKQWMVDYTRRTGYWPIDGGPDTELPEYGEVFGLTVENLNALARRIAPNVARTVRRRLLN